MPNSSTPSGSIFNNAATNTSSQQTQQNAGDQTANNNGSDSNDTVESLVSRLTSGVVIPKNEGSNDTAPTGGNNPNPNPSATPSTNDSNNSPQSNVIKNMMQEFRGQSLTEGVDVDAIAERLQNGDLGGIVDAIEVTSGKAIERALSSVLTIIPEIISQTEARVLEKVSSLNSSDRVWDQFIGQYPDYADHKGTVREHLQRAIDSGADLDQSFKAVDLIFGNLRKPVKKPAEEFTPEAGSEAFDLSNYVGNT